MPGPKHPSQVCLVWFSFSGKHLYGCRVDIPMYAYYMLFLCVIHVISLAMRMDIYIYMLRDFRVRDFYYGFCCSILE